jgi:hypothetical protein
MRVRLIAGCEAVLVCRTTCRVFAARVPARCESAL